MKIREATAKDIPQLHLIRISVKENSLSRPYLISTKDYEEYLVNRGKGWVCEIDNVIVGFAIVDLFDHNVWALFIQPGFDRKGIGKKLHDEMLSWYFNESIVTLWLSTAPGTRAEKFYRTAGWKQNGFQSNGEVRFEMRAEDWHQLNDQCL
jgi:GNAT superfamily N-acetyltransferase